MRHGLVFRWQISLWARRIAWFAGLWLVSVAALALVAFALRAVLAP